MSGGIFIVGLFIAAVGLFVALSCSAVHKDNLSILSFVVFGLLSSAIIAMSFMYDSMEHLKFAMQYNDVKVMTFDVSRTEESMKEMSKYEKDGWTCVSSKEFTPFDKPADVTFRTVIMVKGKQKRLTVSEQFDALK